MGHYSEVQLVKECRTVSNSEYFEQGFLQSKKKKKPIALSHKSWVFLYNGLVFA